MNTLTQMKNVNNVGLKQSIKIEYAEVWESISVSFKKTALSATIQTILYSNNIYNYFSLASSESSDDAFLLLALENLRSANPKPNRPAPVINTHSSSVLIDGNVGSIRARNKMTQVDDTTQNAPMTLLEDQR